MAENIEVIEPKLFPGVVADEIVASIRDAISEKDRCSLALSGGGTPSGIYRLLSKPPRISEIEWEKMDLYWGDERYVPHDHVASNYRMVRETMLAHLNQNKPRVHALDTTLADPNEAAKKYEQEIRKAEGISAGVLPEFDIVLLGVGEDGHTASLFPGSPALNTPPNIICVAAEHPEGGYRVSLTQHAIFNAKKIIYIIKGGSKADIVRRIIKGDEDTSVIPARFYLPARDRVTFFLDSEAAQKLDH